MSRRRISAEYDIVERASLTRDERESWLIHIDINDPDDVWLQNNYVAFFLLAHNLPPEASELVEYCKRRYWHSGWDRLDWELEQIIDAILPLIPRMEGNNADAKT